MTTPEKGQYLYPLSVAGVPIVLRSQNPLNLPDYFRPFGILKSECSLEKCLSVEVAGVKGETHISFTKKMADPEQSGQPFFAPGEMAGDLASKSSFTTDVSSCGSSYVLRIPNEKYEEFCRCGKWLNHLHFEDMFLESGRIILHASAVIYRGEAYVFSAPSGTGKSTQARLWEQYAGARILNGDKVVLEMRNMRRNLGEQKEQEEQVVQTVQKVHTIQKLGRAMPEFQVFAHGSPIAGSSGIYRQECAPVRGIFFLEQSGESSRNCLGKLTTRQSLLALYSESVKFRSPGQNEKLLGFLAETMEICGCYRYVCLPEEQAVWDLCEQLADLEKMEENM